jgi:hypothetical protein
MAGSSEMLDLWVSLFICRWDSESDSKAMQKNVFFLFWNFAGRETVALGTVDLDNKFSNRTNAKQVVRSS